MAIRPERLEAGDTVGVVSVGSPLSREVIDERIAYLESLGLRVIIGEHTYEENGFLAGDDESRAEDFMNMVVNNEVKMILPVRGGVGVIGMLKYLDYNLIQANPKIVTGYSDVTILLNALYEFANVESLHSLMLIDFKLSTPAFNFDRFFTAVSEVNEPFRVENPPASSMRSLVPGIATGDIIGGNLTSLLGGLGTPYEWDARGKVLLIEEINDSTGRVYRGLQQLEEAGKLDGCEGFLIGRCSRCYPSYEVSFNQLIESFFVPIGKPTITNIMSGHGTYKTTIPIGAEVTMNADALTIESTRPLVTND
ncbi:LD-carboxypeptidase [Geomicrobium sp. JCM 19039]|uniref:S66 peptidase family protein n=1 Tax=Geomicrobium sp. JCM 19039 TaxID=1460636 RepID=UPI00045F1B43|nr:LD-carboxypeptidase [Geomicrobium sp. JCM 19039]GAK12755.1 muramoyltetrapeptide carboxypeptidase [Geomicrobium sp. JCM 19039]